MIYILITLPVFLFFIFRELANINKHLKSIYDLLYKNSIKSDKVKLFERKN